MAIDAVDRCRIARLAIKLPVSMHIYFEMAIRALHSMREMDVLQVDCLRKLVGIVVRDLVVAEIEQIAFAIVLEDRAKNPAMPVVIGKLGVLELGI